MDGDIGDDPFYRLIFPTMGMLAAHHREKLEAAAATEDPFALKDAVEEIREDLNPHPAGQKELNAGKKGMEDLTGVQHKYAETVLFFASAAQTCHAYCTCAAFPPRPPADPSTCPPPRGRRAHPRPPLRAGTLPLGAVHRRLRPPLRPEGRRLALRLPREAPGGATRATDPLFPGHHPLPLAPVRRPRRPHPAAPAHPPPPPLQVSDILFTGGDPMF